MHRNMMLLNILDICMLLSELASREWAAAAFRLTNAANLHAWKGRRALSEEAPPMQCSAFNRPPASCLSHTRRQPNYTYDMCHLHPLWRCRFEAELRDSSKHDSWQREAVAADLAARAAAVRKRRDEMAATQEAAVQARHQLVMDNLQASHQIKVSLVLCFCFAARIELCC